MSVKDVAARAVENCQHVAGVPLCLPCIEAALRKSYAAGAAAAGSGATEGDLIDNFRAGADYGEAEGSVKYFIAGVWAENKQLVEKIRQLEVHHRATGDETGRLLADLAGSLADEIEREAAVRIPQAEADLRAHKLGAQGGEGGAGPGKPPT